MHIKEEHTQERNKRVHVNMSSMFEVGLNVARTCKTNK